MHDMRVISPGSSDRRHLIKDILGKSDTRESCRKLYTKGSVVTLAQMKWYVKVKKILHNDVDPDNVLVSRDLRDVKLIDWGMWIDQPEGVRASKPLLHFWAERMTIVPSEVEANCEPNKRGYRVHGRAVCRRKQESMR